MKRGFAIAAVLMVCNLGGGCPPQSPGTGDAGAGVPGTPVTDEQRKAVFDVVGATLGGMRVDDPAPAREALVAAFKANPAIEAAGISEDGGVWARFTDNRLLLVAMNNPTPQANGSPRRIIPDETVPAHAPIVRANSTGDAAAPGASRSKESATHLDTDTSTPHSPDFFLFNGYEDDLDGVKAHLNNISSWLTVRGYTDQTAFGTNATIENLLKVKDAGLVYVHGHGTIGFIRDKDNPASPAIPIFGLGTLSFQSFTKDITYLDLLNTNQLGYLITPRVFGDSLDEILRFDPITSSTYFITRNFVAEQWTFQPGAWVYLDACHSDDILFRDACFEKGAGVYLGWDLAARHLDAQETSEYLFSRLLGINDLGFAKYVKAESIPQRAFGLFKLRDDIGERRRTTTPEYGDMKDTLNQSTSQYNIAASFSVASRATLNIHTAEDITLPMLTPSIEQLFIQDQESLVYHEPNILTVAGDFGVDEPHVFVGDNEASIISNSFAQIVCRVSGTDSGEVRVMVRDHISTPRMLTKWNGVASAMAEDSAGGPTDFLNLGVSFRGDVQTHRSKPGETPTYFSIPTFSAIPVVSKVESFQRMGSETCPMGQSGAGYTWSTSGSVDLPVKRVDDEGDRMWFWPGGDGISLSPSGEMEGIVAWGAFKANGVHETGDCQFTPPFDRMADLLISGGVHIKIGPGNYDINEDLDETIGTLHAVSSLGMTAQDLPNDDDPR